MESIYKAGRDLPITIVYTVDGSAVVPTAVDYAIFDEDGVELLARQVDSNFVGGNTESVITVAAAINTINDAAEGRLIVLYLTTADGEVEVNHFYVLERNQVLQVMENSFMTYQKALAMRAKRGGLLSRWDVATETERSAALQSAFENMMRIRYKYPTGDIDARLGQQGGSWYLIPEMREETITNFNVDWPAAFRNALLRAQLIEADAVMGGDTVGDKRRSGVISETIGESSMFLRPSAPLRMAISEKAMREISGFIHRDYGTGRS